MMASAGPEQINQREAKGMKSFAMSRDFRRRPLAMATAAVFVLLVTTASMWAQQGTTESWKPVEDAMGRSGTPMGEVLRFAMPRKDLHVMVSGTAIKTGLALGSWAAFKKMDKDAMVMGDLVLTEEEVQPVMRKLQEGGIEIAAIHNHLIGEQPRILYMHIASRGDAVKMATAIRDALALSKTPGPDAAGATASSELTGIEQKKIEEILGRSGKVNGGILQFGVPRAETITDDAMVVPPSMGVGTAINFQPTGDGKAAISGDFVLLGQEVNPVMKALREHGIDVTAVHSHMPEEEPRLIFMHFWANDDADKLAKGLRAALDLTNSAKK
jgi:biotin operon repressor